MSFDWRTDEDGGAWDVVEDSCDPDGRKRPGGRRWRWRWLIPVGLLLAALAAMGWTLNRRVQEATGRVEADILASVALVEEAASAQDAELFQSLLSGRDEAWGTAVTVLAAEGVLGDRSGLGLHLPPQAKPVTMTVTVAADLLSAEVVGERPYTIDIGSGLTETVMLRETAVYRLGPDRWLLSPPDEAFWGGERQNGGRYVTLTYPARDEAIARKLLLYLDAKVGELCSQLADTNCPDDLSLRVELSTNPAVLAAANVEAAVFANKEGRLLLPAPTLAGLPVDAQAEQALFRGYGRLAAAAILTDLWGYECCALFPVYEAVLREALRQLGLEAWPGEVGTAVSQAAYDALAADGLTLAEVETATETERETRAAVVAEFAKETLGLTPPELAQSLNGDAPQLEWWLRQAAGLSGSSVGAENLDLTWQKYLYDHSTQAQTPPPAPLPAQDLQMICHLHGEERNGIYRYDVAADDFTLLQPLDRQVYVVRALPQDDGLALWAVDFGSDQSNLFLWQDGVRTDLPWRHPGPAPSPMRSDPAANNLLFAPSSLGQSEYGVLAAADCLGGDCQLHDLAGYPTWSPDGAHMILLETTEFRPHMAAAWGQLTLADGVGEPLAVIGAGASPFWLDEERYGFVVDAGEGRRDVILTGTVGESGSDTLLTMAELTAGLPERERRFDFVAVQPQKRERLVVVTLAAPEAAGAGPEATLWLYDLARQERLLALPFAQDVGMSRSYRFSPDGRFLLFGEGDETQPAVLYFLDLEGEQVDALPLQANYLDSIDWYTDWSADGRWLLVEDDGFLHLLLPGTAYERLVIPTMDYCETAVWVNH